MPERRKHTRLLDEVELTAGPDPAVVDPAAGGRLSSLIAGGRERLVGPPADPSQRLSTLWGCFPMAPWAGRIADGRLEWEGQSYGLRRNAGGHSIQGVVFDVPWMVTVRNQGRVEMTASDLPGWPFEGIVNQRIELAPGRIALLLDVVAGEPMPAWVGWHPWFRRPESGDMHVQVTAGRILETREDLIPTGHLIDVEGPTDLRDGPALGDRRLDHVYADAKSPATISWPDLELTMQLEPPLAAVVVHTPGRGVCVEPPDCLTGCPQAGGRRESHDRSSKARGRGDTPGGNDLDLVLVEEKGLRGQSRNIPFVKAVCCPDLREPFPCSQASLKKKVDG